MSDRSAANPSEANTEIALRAKFKQQLRERMKTLRGALPAAAVVQRSTQIAQRVFELEAYQRAQTLLVYSPFRNEVDSNAIVSRAREQKKNIVLPCIDTEQNRIVLRGWDAGCALELGAFGISEPPVSAKIIDAKEIDLVLVPCLAVDTRGHRIGYGKGFYDALLPTLTRATRLALIYDFQLIAEMPNLSHDVAVDIVVTDTRILSIKE